MIDLRRVHHHHADVIVVGAGIFGTAVAITFARQNRSVFLLERSLEEPDRIVGELLQPGGVQALEALGLGDCLEGIDAIPVSGYEFYYNSQPIKISYPFRDPPGNDQSSERFQGRSFHHGRFVRKLRESAAREPNITMVETLVTGLVTAEDTDQVLGVRSLSNDKPDCFFAPLTVVADGFKSRFRSKAARSRVESHSRFWALELQDAVLPSPGFGHVVLGEVSPIILYQIGTHETRALVNVPEGLQAAKSANGGVMNYIQHNVLPSLPASIQPSFRESLEKCKLRCMPNSYLPAASNRTAGLLVAGDALNMRHPLTGGGMTVALNDVVLLGQLLHPSQVPDLESSARVLQQMSIFHWRRKRHAFVMNILAQTSYALFAADDYYLDILRQGCFGYFKRGGAYVDGPASLMGGIAKEPFTIVYHFFAVAFLSLQPLFLSRPFWQLPIILFECVVVWFKACWVIFPYIVWELGG